MASEVLAQIKCLQCGNPNATVHRQAGRRTALYYRCYERVGSQDAVCGTIQCTGPKGQELIEAAMSEAAKGQNPPPKPQNPPKGQNPPEPPPADPPKKSWFDRFMEDDEE